MGKAQNIARMRRMKEAKRKMEAALQPRDSATDDDDVMNSAAGKAMLRRSMALAPQVLKNRPGVKYSDLLSEFAEPLVDLNERIDAVKDGYRLGIVIWNLACIKQKNPVKFVSEYAKFAKGFAAVPGLTELVEQMIEEKISNYPNHNCIILDFEVSRDRQGGGYNLVVSYDVGS